MPEQIDGPEYEIAQAKDVPIKPEFDISAWLDSPAGKAVMAKFRDKPLTYNQEYECNFKPYPETLIEYETWDNRRIRLNQPEFRDFSTEFRSFAPELENNLIDSGFIKKFKITPEIQAILDKYTNMTVTATTTPDEPTIDIEFED